MEQQKIDMFMMTNAKYFPEENAMAIRQRLENTDDSKMIILSTAQFKDPTTSLLLSLFGGGLGLDRFYIGDIGLGVGKLLTLGGCGIWALIDLFLITGATRTKNFEKILPLL